MASNSLQACIESIIDIITAIGGINQAPDFIPEKVSAFPFLAVYAWGGLIEHGPVGSTGGIMRRLDKVAVELHINRKILPIDLEKAMNFGDSIPNALYKDNTLGGTCSTFGNITYELGDMDWGNTQTLGFRFIINEIKIEKVIT